MSKKEKSFVTGSVIIKGTFSQLRDPVDKKEVRSRGPGQIGQSKPSATVRLGRIGMNELTRRLAMAVRVLETGKGPAKGEDANLAKLKEVQEELQGMRKELHGTKHELQELTDKHELTIGAFQEQTKTLEATKQELFQEQTKTSEAHEPEEEVKDSEEVKSEVEEPTSSLEEKLKAADPALEVPDGDKKEVPKKK